MKKYLMTGIAAVAMCAAFTSCSKDVDFGQTVQEDRVQAKYDQAFLNYIGGPIDPNQDWGFSATRGITRSNPGDTYPQTEAYHNMNHNEWADPDKEFGGYTVPDPLTENQKKVVAAYFQTVSPLSYEDPHLRHFFVQQVYKGGKTTVRNTTEGIIAADNSAYTSDNMNLLSVGQNNIHINDFNKGDCSPSNVLDNGQHVGGSSHEDQITLMVNIDDTSCFGYHETGSSTQHNNKAALVGWETIHTWAQTNYPGYDGCLDDKWERSYLGFDLALKEGAQAQSNVAVKYNDGPDGNYSYAKINNEIVSVNGNTSMNIYYLDTNTNMYVAADKKNIGDGDFVHEYRVNGDYKGKYIDVDYLMTLINDGWLPVKDKNLREWVKVGTSDGYYSDWIVTLTEAKRKGSEYDLKIIAEDLSAQGNSDFDFNDIVLEVKYATSTTPTKVRLTHAGGTLPLIISLDGSTNETFEVHDIFDVQRNEMVNTGAGPTRTPVVLTDLPGFNVSIANATEANSKLRLFVFKENAWHEMKAPRGEPACKLAVGMDYGVLRERVSIKGTYELFVDWATSANFTSKWWTTNNQ
jgi:regulation of enolase protein 1 (concanavalin A-like superfamily)